jgi:hypothetical protein
MRRRLAPRFRLVHREARRAMTQRHAVSAASLPRSFNVDAITADMRVHYFSPDFMARKRGVCDYDTCPHCCAIFDALDRARKAGE